MRTLVWITTGFACACVAGVYVAPGIWLVPLAVFCLAGLLAAICMNSKFSRIAVRLLAGCLIGIIWMFAFDRLYLRSALDVDAQVQSLQVELTDYSYHSGNGSAANGKISLDGKTYKVKVYLKEKQPLKPADVVSGDFLLRYTADGGSRKPTYHQGNGVFLLGYAQDMCAIVEAERIPARYFPAYLAKELSECIKKLFSGGYLSVCSGAPAGR